MSNDLIREDYHRSRAMREEDERRAMARLSGKGEWTHPLSSDDALRWAIKEIAKLRNRVDALEGKRDE